MGYHMPKQQTEQYLKAADELLQNYVVTMRSSMALSAFSKLKKKLKRKGYG